MKLILYENKKKNKKKYLNISGEAKVNHVEGKYSTAKLLELIKEGNIENFISNLRVITR